MPLLSDRVKEAVQEAKKSKSVKDVASGCGVSVQTIYAWQKGFTSNLKGETLVELAEVSGLNARWIINGKGPKHGLTPDEKTLIEGLRAADASERATLLALANLYITRAAESSKAA